MARAKSIQRAEARRRYRATHSAMTADPADPTIRDDGALAPGRVAGRGDGAGAPGASPFRFSRPDVRADIRALPGMFRTRLLLWLPFLMLTAGFLLAMVQVAVANSGRTLDPQVNNAINFYWGLVLPPLALFPAFIAGFLAPRAAYLVGLLIGILDGIFWGILVLVAPVSTTASSGAVNADRVTAALLSFPVAVVSGMLAAAFAAWYSRFLRQSGEKRRAAAIERNRAKKIEDRKRPRTGR